MTHDTQITDITQTSEFDQPAYVDMPETRVSYVGINEEYRQRLIHATLQLVEQGLAEAFKDDAEDDEDVLADDPFFDEVEI